MSEKQVPYVDPSDITYLDTDIPGFRIPLRKTVLRLKPENTGKNMSERDTHFIGFARALLNDIFDEREGSLILGRDLYPQDNERVAQHIARRAYDLVYFLLDKAEYHSGSFDVGWGTPDEIHEAISHLPDMTEWPVEPT